MKILTIIHEYPPIGGGGGRVAQDLINGFLAKGHAVKVITARMNGSFDENDGDYFSIIRTGKIRKAAYHVSIWEMLNFDFEAFFTASKVIKEWKPDVIHAHFAVPAGAVAYLLSFFFKVPYVLTAHLGDVPEAVPEKTSGWFKWVYPFTPPIWGRASKVIAVSDFTKTLANKHYKVDIDVIHNGVDLETLPTPNKENNPSKPIKLIFAGRLTEQKNPFDMINSLGMIKDVNWTLSVMGDGPLMLSTKHLAEKLGVMDKVTFYGWVTPEQVLSAFAEHDVLLLPSSSEGLSVVGVQALAMGLVMILSDAGGNPELVNGKNGALIQVGDVKALANHIRVYAEDREKLRFAQQASADFAQKFALRTIVDQYLAAMESVR